MGKKDKESKNRKKYILRKKMSRKKGRKEKRKKERKDGSALPILCMVDIKGERTYGWSPSKNIVTAGYTVCCVALKW